MKIRILFFVIFVSATYCISNQQDKCLALLAVDQRDMWNCHKSLVLSGYIYIRGNPNKPGDKYYDPSQSPWHNIALVQCIDVFISTRSARSSHNLYLLRSRIIKQIKMNNPTHQPSHALRMGAGSINCIMRFISTSVVNRNLLTIATA